MNRTSFKKLVAVVSGALVAVAAVAVGSAVAQRTGSTGAGRATHESGARAASAAAAHEPAGSPQSPQSPQEPAGAQMIFNSIFEFTDSVNDLFVWGWMPTISGSISDNAFLGGQRIEITPDASIGGDLFMFAQSGEVNAPVGGDLYAMVGELSIGSTGSVDGAVYGSSGRLTIEGELAGPLRFAAGVIEINGTVRGDVVVEAGELQIGPDAVITGDLSYESAREASIDPAADVQGEIRYVAPRDDEEEEESEDEPAARSAISLFGVLWDAWWLLSSFLVGAIALWLGGEAARRPAARLAREPALGLGFGFVVAVVIPAAALLAMVLLVTIPLGLIILALYAAAGYLARLVVAQAIGDKVLRTVRGGRQASAYASLALGLLLFYFLTQIPYVGFLIWLAAVVAGLGGIFLATRRPPLDEPEVPPPPAVV